MSIPPPARFSVVVPVKGTPDGKSRLMPERSADERMLLAEAFALDAVAALQSARLVARVIVVTAPGAGIADRLRLSGADVVTDPGRGLNAAVAAGIARVDEGRPVAALLADLPGLTADDVDAALEAAAGHPLALVADAEGTGSTLITASRPGERPLVPRFGAGSAARHRAAGHVEPPLRPGTTLRHDVDTEADLQAAVARGVGPRTRAVLRMLSARAASEPSSRR